nr:hypothetical protein BaRGS_015894 [Batillaria attramentaria]
MSNSHNQQLSQALRSAECKNSLTSNALHKELDKLDHDRVQRMKELNQDVQHLREELHASPGPSRPASSQPHHHIEARSSPTLQKASERKTSKSKSGDAHDGHPKRERKISVCRDQPLVQVHVTQTGGPQRKGSHDHSMEDRAHIVVMDSKVDKRSGEAHASPNLARRGSHGNVGGPIGSRRSSVDYGECGVPAGSPSLSARRSRSNSVTGAHLAPHTPLRRISVCPLMTRSRDGLHVPDTHRERSSSFSHGIVPVRRRGSICERFGSVSERELARGTDHERRESITNMEHMIRDLNYGIQHRELLHGKEENQTTVSPQLWQELKGCRYLRMPSRDHSEDED